jgi:polar amino acid transport system ATP-binding protein
MPRLPVIDLSLARSGASWLDHLAAQIDWAAAEFGFFYVIGHDLNQRAIEHLQSLSREFFAWPLHRKLELHMKLGGRAWRGYFPVGGELTSGRPDFKEGLYLGEELGEEDVRVAQAWPLHGKNLFPGIAGFDAAVTQYQEAMTRLGHDLMSLFARGLGLQDDFFRSNYTARPTTLFRIFNYPAGAGDAQSPVDSFGVGAHTDYGLLTLLHQDEVGGLEVRYEDEWVEVPYLPGTLVVNIGDMLERLTAGRYTSALHRVINRSGRARLSMPFFFDPAFDAGLAPIPELTRPPPRAGRRRWDGIELDALTGTYGEYLMSKVTRVFPDLSRALKPQGITI